MDPVTIGTAVCLLVGVLFLHWQMKPRLMKIYQGSALVRHRQTWLPGGGTTVSFSSNYVIKLLDKFEVVDITTKNLRYDIAGQTMDGREFTVKGELILRMPKDENNVLVALEEFGPEGLSNPSLLKERFEASFSRATKSAASTMEAEKWPGSMDIFRDSVLEKFGPCANGFHVDAAFIDLQIK